MGPLVGIEPDGILYTKVKVEDVEEIVQKTLVEGKLVERLLYVDPNTGQVCLGPKEIPFYRQQQRTVLAACGHIDPGDIGEYISHGGYEAALQVWTQMTPEAVCEEVSHSGVRGRGGGGFPTGRKWGTDSRPGRPRKVRHL